MALLQNPRDMIRVRILSEIWRRGHWKWGVCIKLSEIDFQIRDKFVTILRILSLMHKMKYRQFCANLAHNLRQICATPPSRTPPSRNFWFSVKWFGFRPESQSYRPKVGVTDQKSEMQPGRPQNPNRIARKGPQMGFRCFYRSTLKAFLSPLKADHPLQNYCTHEITIFELFRGLQLQLSGVFQICITVTGFPGNSICRVQKYPFNPRHGTI